MKRLSITAVSLLGAALVAGVAPPADAQLYRWTNEQGELHITEGLDSVPERFRKSAVLLGHPPARVSPPTAAQPSPPTPSLPAAPGPAAAPLPLATPGTEGQLLARIPYVPGTPILVTARVNGGRSVQLILDTGAEVTMISPQALSALGVEMRPVRAARIQGVAGTGTLDVPSIMLDSVEVGEAKAGPLEVLAHNPSLTRGEGLLGRDFLDRFTVSIDTRAREVRLGRR